MSYKEVVTMFCSRPRRLSAVIKAKPTGQIMFGSILPAFSKLYNEFLH